MLHGHAKIELTNIKTGETQVVEHDNMLTTWIKDFFTPDNFQAVNPLRCYYNESQQSGNWSKANLFGGLLMFESALSNDPADHIIPKNNKMIAHGTNETYSGTDTTMGSFNSGLSSITEHEMVSVWDFTPEQGNGTIASLGLCNTALGKTGCGQSNPDINTHYLGRHIHELDYGANGGANAWDAYRGLWVSYTDSIFYVVVSMASGVLTIRRYYFPWSKYDSILQTLYGGSTEFNAKAKNDTFTIDISAYISGNTIPMFTAENGVFYFIEASNWANNASKTVVMYDLATGTITTKSLTNRTGETIVCNGSRHGVCAVYDGILYAITSSSHVAFINLADDTDYGLVSDRSNNTLALYNGNTSSRFGVAAGRLYIAPKQYGFNISNGTNGGGLYILYTKGKADPTAFHGLGRYGTTNEGEVYGIVPGDSKKNFSYIYDNYSGQRLWINAFSYTSLTTKQNLETAVTKTADMSMRVTYTITDQVIEE